MKISINFFIYIPTSRNTAKNLSQNEYFSADNFQKQELLQHSLIVYVK